MGVETYPVLPDSVATPAAESSVNSLKTSFSFDNFISFANNRLALAACHSVAENFISDYNPLFIYGPSGCGKTHLLRALANRLEEKGKTAETVFIVSTHQVPNFASLFSRPNSPSLVIIDSLQDWAASSQLQSELLAMVNMFHSTRKQIVVSANTHPRDLKHFDPRIVNRFLWGVVLEIETPTQEFRREFIAHKSRALKMNLSEEMISEIAVSPLESIGEIEGVLLSIFSHAKLLESDITPSLIRKILDQYMVNHVRQINLEDICAFICREFSLSAENLVSKARNRSISYPRQIAMYLAQTNTKLSLEDIGRFFGGRDHSTVKHGCEKIKGLSRTNHALRSLVDKFNKEC